MPADEFVRDPRVAMALMERWVAYGSCDLGCEDGEFFCDADELDEYGSTTRATGKGDSLPRAIVEACVKALEES